MKKIGLLSTLLLTTYMGQVKAQGNSHMKVAVIGCPGSGKSTLSAQLQKIVTIPLFHLDQYYFRPQWGKRSPEEFKTIHHNLCDQPEWIIDGTATRYFEYRAEQADIIIFCDIPQYICLWRTFKRAFQYFGRVFPFSAQGCPEKLPDREFLKYILTFNKEKKPEIQRIINKYKDTKKIFIINNNSDIKKTIEFFKGIDI